MMMMMMIQEELSGQVGQQLDYRGTVQGGGGAEQGGGGGSSSQRRCEDYSFLPMEEGVPMRMRQTEWCTPITR